MSAPLRGQGDGVPPPARHYADVGPHDIAAAVRDAPPGAVIATAEAFAAWVAMQSAAELADVFTFTVGLDGVLRLAPRRSEHVACAGGEPVLSAGEIGFERAASGWAVRAASNQSTGYCPEPASWAALAAALDRCALAHGGQFTDPIVFRLCEACGQRNIVRDGDYACALRGADLPRAWNFRAEP